MLVCACCTQGTQSARPVEAYINAVIAEAHHVAKLCPDGIRMGRLHWGGGTPTILLPALIERLAEALKEAFPTTPDWQFSVEIDPTTVDEAKIAALAAAGMSRASIGIQDFTPKVKTAIGRSQSFEITCDCVTSLCDAGGASLNTDIVYGLPP